jgi:hypothetical protein
MRVMVGGVGLKISKAETEKPLFPPRSGSVARRKRTGGAAQSHDGRQAWCLDRWIGGGFTMLKIILIAAMALFLTGTVALGATDYALALIGAPVLSTVAVLLAAAIAIAPTSGGFTPPPGCEPHQGQ